LVLGFIGGGECPVQLLTYVDECLFPGTTQEVDLNVGWVETQAREDMSIRKLVYGSIVGIIAAYAFLIFEHGIEEFVGLLPIVISLTVGALGAAFLISGFVRGAAPPEALLAEGEVLRRESRWLKAIGALFLLACVAVYLIAG